MSEAHNRPRTYDYATFTVTTGTTDKDISADIAALFSNITTATRFILTTDKAITLKLNSTLMPGFPVNIGDSPFQFPPGYFHMDNLFISNSSGSTATIKIWLFG